MNVIVNNNNHNINNNNHNNINIKTNRKNLNISKNSAQENIQIIIQILDRLQEEVMDIMILNLFIFYKILLFILIIIMIDKILMRSILLSMRINNLKCKIREQ